MSAIPHCAAACAVVASAQLAEMLADPDAVAAQGGLFDDSRTLSKLTGCATTPWQETIAATLKG